tara:strand:- start:92 stop:412 length:321 start_codon:yes stop_codon:yes gene_type:complete
VFKFAFEEDELQLLSIAISYCLRRPLQYVPPHYAKGTCYFGMHGGEKRGQAPFSLHEHSKQENADRAGSKEEVQQTPSSAYSAQGSQELAARSGGELKIIGRKAMD